MRRRSFMAVGALVACTALLGCAPHWRVVVEGPGEPLFHQRRFAMMPVDFTGLQVGSHTEQEHLDKKSPEQQDSFDQDKAALSALFMEELRSRAHDMGIVVEPATGPTDAPFVIRPSVAFIEPGFFALVVNEPSRVEMNVKITSGDGRIVDEILLTHRTRGTLGVEASSGGRLRKDGAGLGEWVAEYLRRRVLAE
jgi:hypothetical protein